MPQDISFRLGEVVVVGTISDDGWFAGTAQLPFGGEQALVLNMARATYSAGGGGPVGTPLPDEEALMVKILEVASMVLTALAELPGLPPDDKHQIEQIGNLFSLQATALKMGEAYPDVRDAVQVALEAAFGLLSDKVLGVVVGGLLSAMGISMTSPLGPGAIAGGLVSFAAGYWAGEHIPADDLAEITTDFIFNTGEAIASWEWNLGQSLSDLSRDFYYGVINEIRPGGGADGLPYTLYQQMPSAQKAVDGITVFDGNGWFNVASFQAATTAVTVDLALTTAQNTGGGGMVRFVTVEGVQGSAYADTLLGNAFGNHFTGGGGADYIDGRGGFDFADYRSATSAVVVNLAAGTATGGGGSDTLVSIEGVWGTHHNDTLTGTSGSNTLVGGRGNDTLNGGAGDDLLIGHGGAFLSSETNYLNGGDGFDRISFAAETTAAIPTYPVFNVTVNLATGIAQFTRGSFTVTNHLTSIEGVTGGLGNDTITGNAVANELLGGDGADWINGGDGDDYIDGGLRQDTLIGGAGRDILSFLSSNLAVTASLSSNTASTGDAISGFESLMGSLLNDTLTGDAGANELFGADGADVLAGGDGDDLLVGGKGADVMTGGLGADVFRILNEDWASLSGEDWITDLGAGDIVDLSDIDADWDAAGNQAFSFAGALTGVAGQAVLAYDAVSNRTLLSLDGDGDGLADFSIRLTGDQTAFTGFIL